MVLLLKKQCLRNSGAFLSFLSALYGALKVKANNLYLCLVLYMQSLINIELRP